MDTRPWIPVDCLLLMFPSFFTQLDSLFIFSAKPDCLMLVFCEIVSNSTCEPGQPPNNSKSQLCQAISQMSETAFLFLT